MNRRFNVENLVDGSEQTQEISSGYKCTEMGVIPQDWDVARIDSHATIKTGTKNTEDKEDDGEYPFFVRSQEVKRINSYSYDGEAVLTAGDGVGTGKIFHYISGRFDVHQRVYQITNFADRLNGLYFFYQFREKFYRRIISMTAKSSVDSVRLEMIAGMKISLPHPTEQDAIVEALSNMDCLLEALEALLVKMHAIKQATMQKLLTGKIRLPGFSGVWEMKPIDDIFSVRVGSSKTQFIVDGGSYLVIDMGSVTTSGKLVSTKHTNYGDNFLSKGELVMPKDDIGGGNIIGKVAYIDADHKYVLGDHVYALRPLHGHSKFFSYLINGHDTNTSLRRKVGGSAQLGLARRAVEKQEIPVPTPDEQYAIGTILAEIDTAIVALERRREKNLAIRRGMTQQLLTGQIRLVHPEEVTGRAAGIDPVASTYN